LNATNEFAGQAIFDWTCANFGNRHGADQSAGVLPRAHLFFAGPDSFVADVQAFAIDVVLLSNLVEQLPDGCQCRTASSAADTADRDRASGRVTVDVIAAADFCGDFLKRKSARFGKHHRDDCPSSRAKVLASDGNLSGTVFEQSDFGFAFH